MLGATAIETSNIVTKELGDDLFSLLINEAQNDWMKEQMQLLYILLMDI